MDTYEGPCRFCGIEERENQTVLEVRDKVIVVLSNPRLMPGHLLVIPKRHVLNLFDLDADERQELFDTVLEYQGKIMKHLAPGCDVRQHNRPFHAESAIKVDHVHVHLHPRFMKDELHQKSQINEVAVFQPLLDEEAGRISQLLK